MKMIQLLIIIMCIGLAGCVSETPRAARDEMQAIIGRRGTLSVEVTGFDHGGDRLLEPSTAKGLDVKREEGKVIGVFPPGSIVVFKRIAVTTHVYGRYHYLVVDILSEDGIIGTDLLMPYRLIPGRSDVVRMIESAEKTKRPNQALQTTPMTRGVYEKTIEFGDPQRGV